MDAETWSNCPTKLRDSGLGLYSYLSSGRSSAMAMIFRPISFHCDSTICDSVAMAFGASFFLLRILGQIGGRSWAAVCGNKPSQQDAQCRSPGDSRNPMKIIHRCSPRPSATRTPPYSDARHSPRSQLFFNVPLRLPGDFGLQASSYARMADCVMQNAERACVLNLELAWGQDL